MEECHARFSFKVRPGVYIYSVLSRNAEQDMHSNSALHQGSYWGNTQTDDDYDVSVFVNNDDGENAELCHDPEVG